MKHLKLFEYVCYFLTGSNLGIRIRIAHGVDFRIMNYNERGKHILEFKEVVLQDTYLHSMKYTIHAIQSRRGGISF